jgi:DNA-binding response OmpR family regulator
MKATIKLSILFVDDDPSDRAIFLEEMAATESPHSVSLAATVAEARSLREFAACDVVVCRDRLPDGGAFDLLDRGSNRVAILMVAPGNEALASEGASFGVRDYVVRDKARHYLRELPWRIEFVFRRGLERQRLREQVRILDLAPVLVRDLDDRIILWNRGAENL